MVRDSGAIIFIYPKANTSGCTTQVSLDSHLPLLSERSHGFTLADGFSVPLSDLDMPAACSNIVWTGLLSPYITIQEP